MSGFCVSAARLAMPDAGLISYGEMEDVGRHITQATSAGFPFIGDADDGYGNAMNAKRTVRGYARAGFAGILMEDQLAPKACGHTKPRCLARDEAVARVRAACDETRARCVYVWAIKLTWFFLIGRRHRRVRQVRQQVRDGLAGRGAVEGRGVCGRGRGRALHRRVTNQGGIESVLCKVAPEVPKMANMLEGGGRTPICSPEELQDMGFSVVAYPLTVLGAYVNATERVLREIREDGYPDESGCPRLSRSRRRAGSRGTTRTPRGTT